MPARTSKQKKPTADWINVFESIEIFIHFQPLFGKEQHLDPTHQIKRLFRLHFQAFFPKTEHLSLLTLEGTAHNRRHFCFSRVTFQPRLLVGLLKPSDKGFFRFQSFIDRDSFTKGPIRDTPDPTEDRSLSYFSFLHKWTHVSCFFWVMNLFFFG